MFGDIDGRLLEKIKRRYNKLDDLIGSGSWEHMKWKAEVRALWRMSLNMLYDRTPKEMKSFSLHCIVSVSYTHLTLPTNREV